MNRATRPVIKVIVKTHFVELAIAFLAGYFAGRYAEGREDI